jgi:hypothetical protein
MTRITFPPAACALLEILWRERQLSRTQLIARVEAVLGPGIFGKAATATPPGWRWPAAAPARTPAFRRPKPTARRCSAPIPDQPP